MAAWLRRRARPAELFLSCGADENKHCTNASGVLHSGSHIVLFSLMVDEPGPYNLLRSNRVQ